MRAVYGTSTGDALKLQFSLPLQCPFIKGVGWLSVPQLGRRGFFNLRDRLIIAYSLCENDKYQFVSSYHWVLLHFFANLLLC